MFLVLAELRNTIMVAIALAIAIIGFIAAAHAEGKAIGRVGEWVTRDDDNSQVCRLATDLLPMMPLRLSFCDPDSWTEMRPQFGESLSSGPIRHWLRCDGGACQMHFEDGWRP